MGLEFHDSHFRTVHLGDGDAGNSVVTESEVRESVPKRPSLPALASTSSIPTAPTTAISRPEIDTRAVIETREGYHDLNDIDSLQSGLPSLRSVEMDLAGTLAEVMLETNALRPSELSSSRHDIERGEESEDYLSEDESHTGLGTEQVANLDEESQVKDFLGRSKHFLILSAAGKPIYARHGTEQIVPGYMAIIQAMMGFYQESTKPDVLQSFSCADLQFVMLVKGPVYLVAISKLGEGESTLHSQLKFLYDVVLSNVTKTRMVKLFARGDNFDLGRLLSGSEHFMNTICDQMTYDALHFDVLFSSLSVFRLRSTLRIRIGNILAHYRPVQTPEFLCGIIAVDKKLVSVLHPKGLSLYPADLRLVFETVWNRGIEEGQDHWLPLCLPNFNSSGYLHVFVSFLAPSIAIILISSSKDDFYALQEMKGRLQRKLIKESLVQDLVRAKHTQVTTEILQIEKIVEHFIFRSREHVQYLMPPLPDEFGSRPNFGMSRSPKTLRRPRISRRKLLSIYENLVCPGPPAYRLQVRRFSHRTSTKGQSSEILALTWFTNAFELYVISRPVSASPDNGSSAAGLGEVKVNELIGAANVIQQFVKREEKRVWVDDGVTF